MEPVPASEGLCRAVVVREFGTCKNRETVVSGLGLECRYEQHGADNACSRFGDVVSHGWFFSKRR